MSRSSNEPVQRSTPGNPISARSPASFMLVDQPCLVVQMPTVEEMRKEVADITCQMQSVYFDDQSDSVLAVEADGSNDFATLASMDPNKQSSMFKCNTIAGQYSSKSSPPWANDSPVKFNTLDRSTVTSQNDVQQSMTSSLPREVQVSEEFVINGKRYRQTYRKRVVLERQTTRDIIILPAGSSDSHLTRHSLEYTSPNFSRPTATHDPSTPIHSADRPRIDLTAIRQATEKPPHQTSGLSPAVIMCTATTPLPAQGQSPRNPMDESASDTMADNQPLDGPNRPRKTGIHRSRSKMLVKQLAATLRRHVSAALHKSNSAPSGASEEKNGGKNGRTTTQLVLSTPSNEIASCLSDEDTGKREIVGYMFQFGAWDNNAPVLDPRLPIACSGDSVVGQLGAVFPTPAEWHHAEVGADPSSFDSQGPLVRGRVVACLQRFTQNSSTSGKPLHRTTYVQQMRLVRQRNKQASQTSTTGDTIETDTSQLESSVDENASLTPPGMKLIEMFPKDDARNSTRLTNGVVADETGFKLCGNDRLQLLQSLCPAAAAATILLGREAQPSHTANSDESADEDASPKPESTASDMGRVRVKAHCWCARALVEHDLSEYLVFNHETGNGVNADPKSTGIPHPLLKGGTVDGLVVYALHFLQTNSTDLPLDCLFPQVFRVMYPTFATAEQIAEKLIQIYVAFAPIEPGCLSTDWTYSLTAAEYLVTIIKEVHPEQMTARLVLRMARFASLLIMDGQSAAEAKKCSDQTPDSQAEGTLKAKSPTHRELADRLFDGLPLLAASAQLRSRITQHRLGSGGQLRIDRMAADSKHKQGLNKVGLSKPPIATNHQPDLCVNSQEKDKGLPSDSPWSTNSSTHIEDIAAALHRTEKFLAADAYALAVELTRMEEEKFAGINFLELLDIGRLEHGEAPTLAICVEHFNHVTLWARSQLLIFAPSLAMAEDLPGQQVERKPGDEATGPLRTNQVREALVESGSKRPNVYCIPGLHTRFCIPKPSKVKQVAYINLVFCKLCDVLKHLKALKNFSSFLAILLAIQDVPECLLLKRSRGLLDAYASYMNPPMFSEYRRDLESASLPYLPYLGLIFQQLIHLDAGASLYLSEDNANREEDGKSGSPFAQPQEPANPTSLDDTFKKPKEKFVNMWRCWKHYLILGYFVKRRDDPEKNQHKLEYNQEISEMLSQLKDRVPAAALNEAKYQLLNRKKT